MVHSLDKAIQIVTLPFVLTVPTIYIEYINIIIISKTRDMHVYTPA